MPTIEAKVPTSTFGELTIWRTKLPHVEHAVLPPSNTRPNPVVRYSLSDFRRCRHQTTNMITPPQSGPPTQSTLGGKSKSPMASIR